MDKWDAIIAINLNSAFHTTAAALPMMRKARLGACGQHRLGARADGLALQGGLYRGQAWRGGHEQDCRAGNGGRTDHLQRDLPRIRADPAGRSDRSPIPWRNTTWAGKR